MNILLQVKTYQQWITIVKRNDDFFRRKCEKTRKLNWITEYIRDNGWQDVYMEDFVTSYINDCNPKNVKIMLWGTQKVPELNRYLTELYKNGVLERFTVGLHNWHDSKLMPKWVYGYKIK